MRFFREIKQQLVLIHRINSSQNHLKIMGEEFARNSDDTIFTIQITGKNSFAKVSTNELFEDKELLREFSNFDQARIVKVITLLKKSKMENDEANSHNSYTKPQLYLFEHPTYKITCKTYDRNKKEFIYTIQTSYKGETQCETLSSEEILKNKLVSNKLNFNEGYQVGHSDGAKHAWDSINQISDIKKDKLAKK